MKTTRRGRMVSLLQEQLQDHGNCHENAAKVYDDDYLHFPPHMVRP